MKKKERRLSCKEPIESRTSPNRREISEIRGRGQKRAKGEKTRLLLKMTSGITLLYPTSGETGGVEKKKKGASGEKWGRE